MPVGESRESMLLNSVDRSPRGRRGSPIKGTSIFPTGSPIGYKIERGARVPIYMVMKGEDVKKEEIGQGDRPSYVNTAKPVLHTPRLPIRKAVVEKE